MIKAQITINGETMERSFPQEWSEVNFGLFLKLTLAAGDSAKMFAAITDLPEEQIRKARITGMDTLLAVLSFLDVSPPVDVPETILGYHVPKDLGFECIAQYEDMHDDLKEKREGVEYLERFPLYCAIYACSQKHGEYDWEKAEAMADEFLCAPASEVLAIGNFTLAKLAGLRRGIAPDSLRAAIQTQRSKQGLKSWRVRLASMERFFTWRKRPAINGKSF